MKRRNFKNILFAIAITALIFTTACQQPGGNSSGSEFIPEMTHSVAYEAYVYSDYGLNSFENESVKSRRELSQPRLPVEGTMPRGYVGVASTGRTFGSAKEAAIHTLKMMEKYGEDVFVPNGFVPYYFENSDSGRAYATAQLIYNPFPITKEGLEKGKELYNIYCGICHGEKADGDGYLASERNPAVKYPAAPKNFHLPEYMAASNGRFYHAIKFGINMMGSFADKLSYEERWQVIHYIRSLQAKEVNLIYNEKENTFNPDFGVPFADIEDWNGGSENTGMSEDENAVGGEDHNVEGEHNHDGEEDHGNGH